jgi:uncharacterized protein YdaU (DUF1376 family)
MFSYPFHIRDYLTKTRHLSAMEDLAYRRLLDTYYTEEQPLPADPGQCARLIAMRDHVDAVHAVLSEFFTLADDGWHNERADAEIAKYRDFAEAGRRGAEKRWGAHRGANGEANGEATSPPNARAIATKNQQPKTKVDAPDGVDAEVWSEFVSVRKKRGALITDRVIEGIRKEAAAAGWTLNDALKEVVLRGWQSFKAEWVNKGKKSPEPWDELKGAI